MILDGKGSFEEQVDRAVSDGKMTLGDADEVKNFASFLRKSGKPVSQLTTKAESLQWLTAYAQHYPEDFLRDIPVQAQQLVYEANRCVCGGSPTWWPNEEELVHMVGCEWVEEQARG